MSNLLTDQYLVDLLQIEAQYEQDSMNDYAVSLSLQEGFSMQGQPQITRSSVNHLGEAVIVGAGATPTNPSHYKNADKKYEHRFVAKAWDLEYYLSAATKYIARCGKKPSVGMSNVEKEIQDLEKSITYIQFRIEELRGE